LTFVVGTTAALRDKHNAVHELQLGKITELTGKCTGIYPVTKIVPLLGTFSP